MKTLCLLGLTFKKAWRTILTLGYSLTVVRVCESLVGGARRAAPCFSHAVLEHRVLSEVASFNRLRWWHWGEPAIAPRSLLHWQPPPPAGGPGLGMLREQDLQRDNSKHEQHCWRRFCHQGTCYPGGIKGRLCSSDHMAKTTVASQQPPWEAALGQHEEGCLDMGKAELQRWGYALRGGLSWWTSVSSWATSLAPR